MGYYGVVFARSGDAVDFVVGGGFEWLWSGTVVERGRRGPREQGSVGDTSSRK